MNGIYLIHEQHKSQLNIKTTTGSGCLKDG